MWTVIAKNSGGAAVEVEDLGISIPASGQVTLSDQYTYDEIAGSDDLRALAAAGTLVINDGTSDLSAANGESFLTLTNQKYLSDNHYTKTELSTDGGGGAVHWNNVTNAPSFGSPVWVDPVLYRVLGTELASAPGSPATGDVYVDTSDQYHKYNGATWDLLGTAADGDRVIDLSHATEDILEITSGTWASVGVADDNAGVMVDDDGDAKQAQYVYSTASSSWSKIADVDFSGHLDGGSGKHDASEIDVEGTYTYISTSDLETGMGDIDTELGNLNSAVGSITGNTLDGAYDQGGAGAGRVITADNGPVQIDTSAATTAGLEIVPKAAAPSTGLAGGQFHIDSATGILYVYDATRSKWLSVNRFTVAFGEKGNVKDRDLAHYIGKMKSRNSGLRMIRDACIVGAAGHLDASGTCNMRIRSNDSATNLATVAISAAVGAQDGALNVNLVAGDYLQSFLEATTAVEDPTLIVELAWRL
jgi:hypothetical protein